MKSSLLKKFFSSGLQAIGVKIIGLLFFYIISFYLPKADFGIISWANAVALVLTLILGLGLEQIVIRRIAASNTSDWAASAYLLHSFVTSVVMMLILLAVNTIVGDDDQKLHYLPWFFAAQAILYIVGPVKQFLNAKRIFLPYAIVAICSNLLKIVFAFWAVKTQTISIKTISIILIGTAAFELVTMLIYATFRKNFGFRFKWVAYGKLLKEAFPQYIAVLFDSSLARIDWILLGILCTNVVTAEYSFAYRAYEMAKLPLTVLDPVTLSIFARMLVGGKKLAMDRQDQIVNLFRVEIFMAMLIPLSLNIIWSPVLDHFFHKNYGSINALSFLILSLCIPFQFFINILWSLSISDRQYKGISKIIGFTAIINLVLNLVMIPLWGGVGAAVAFLITSVLQLFGYYRLVDVRIMKFPYKPFLVFYVLSIACYFAATWATANPFIQIGIAVSLYLILSFVFRFITKQHISSLKVLLVKA